MTRIVAVAPELPEYAYSQADITRELAPLISADPARRAVMERMHASTGIGTRHTALPLDQYRSLGAFGDTNDTFITVATNLAERALAAALASAGLDAKDVDFIMFTSVTGISAPSIDALLSDLSKVPEAKRTAVRNNGGGHYNASGGKSSESLDKTIQKFKQSIRENASLLQ